MLDGVDGRSPAVPLKDRNSALISHTDTISSPRDDEPFIKSGRIGSGISQRFPWRNLSYASINRKSNDDDEVTPHRLSDDSESKNVQRPKAFHKSTRFWRLKLGKWKQPVRHFSIFLVLFLVVFLPLWFVAAGWVAVGTDDPEPFQYDCYGDGSWSFVGIDLHFGSFSYGQAKALDLAWNWVVGRGLQAILTWMAYRVFSDALLRVAEITPISFELYAALGLYSTKSEILWQLLKGLRKFGNWRVKFIFVWLLISTTYLVSFPSLLDACSGYEAAQQAKFQWPNGTTQDTDSLHIGESSGLGANSNNIETDFEACVVYYQNGSEVFNITWMNLTSADIAWENIVSLMRQNQSWYYDYMSDPRNPENVCDNFANSQANVTGIRKSVANLVLYSWTDVTLNTTWWEHFNQDPSSSQPNSWAGWHFYPTNQSNFMCNTLSNEYQWGFSYEWLFLVSILNSIWCIGMWVLWLDCDMNSEFCRKGRRLGLWRAIADISEAMHEELGSNICAYSEHELADALEKKPPIKYYAQEGEENKPGHIGLSSRPSRRLKLHWEYEYGG